MNDDTCPLCLGKDEIVLWQGAQCRVLLTPQSGYPAFCRVIWQTHVREMSDLSAGQREHFMEVVWAVEESLRSVLHPDKVNLASLGNQVPHLHWHVIPRFSDDAHFPDAIWAAPRREGVEHPINHEKLAQALRERLPEA